MLVAPGRCLDCPAPLLHGMPFTLLMALFALDVEAAPLQYSLLLWSLHASDASGVMLTVSLTSRHAGFLAIPLALFAMSLAPGLLNAAYALMLVSACLIATLHLEPSVQTAVLHFSQVGVS